jgi:hypothetical protein
MMRKFALALIATTMLVAPAFADAVKPTPAAPATTAASTVAPKAVTKTDKHLKSFKVAHHHMRHLTVAKNGKHTVHVKTAKVSKPVATVTAAPTVSTAVSAASTAPAVKVIKAGKDTKKVKVAHRHNVRHLAIAGNGKHSSHVKTVKVSKPVKHAGVVKAHGQVEVKSNKVIAN